MHIRDAKITDFSDLERMGIAFARAAGQVDVDSDTLASTVGNLMKNGILKVVENGSVIGCIGALVFPHWWNKNEIVAQELFWWLDEEYRGTSAGIKLLIELEKEAKSRGAEKLMMLCLDDLNGNKMANMYSKLGYVPQERTFTKVL